MKTETMEQPTEATEASKTKTQPRPNEMPEMTGEVTEALVTLARYVAEHEFNIEIRFGEQGAAPRRTVGYFAEPLLKWYEECRNECIAREAEIYAEKKARTEQKYAAQGGRGIVPDSVKGDTLYLAALYAYQDASEWFGEAGHLEFENDPAFHSIQNAYHKAEDVLNAVVDATIARKIAEAINPDKLPYDTSIGCF